MKRRDLERHLREHGCRHIGEGARHAKWRGPGGRPSAVPRHAEIAPDRPRDLPAARYPATSQRALSAPDRPGHGCGVAARSSSSPGDRGMLLSCRTLGPVGCDDGHDARRLSSGVPGSSVRLPFAVCWGRVTRSLSPTAARMSTTPSPRSSTCTAAARSCSPRAALLSVGDRTRMWTRLRVGRRRRRPRPWPAAQLGHNWATSSP